MKNINKKKSKKNKGKMSWYLSLTPGDVELGTKIFNASTAGGGINPSEAPIAENVEEGIVGTIAKSAVKTAAKKVVGKQVGKAIGNKVGDAINKGIEKKEEEKPLEENSNKYRRVKKALFGDASNKIKTFAIISAYNPLGWKNASEEEYKSNFQKWLNNPSEYNKIANKNIKKDILKDRVINSGDETIRYGHFDYVEIKGFYGEHERTLMIFNLPLIDAKQIASKYGQESFFFGKAQENGNSKIGYFEATTPACKNYNLVEVSDVITFEDDAIDFFSKYGIKFRINMNTFGDKVTPISDYDFEESMSEERTFQSRAMYRRKTKEDIDVNLNEGGLSRILTHTSDEVDFAVIGSEDKDTKEDRFNELVSKVKEVASKNKNIGWKYLEGTYTYEDDGTTSVERSIIVYNIKKEDALRIARELNQETIIWKDKDYFGFLTSSGKPDGELGRGISLDKEKVAMYGSKLLGKHNKAKAFVFEVLIPSIKGSTFSKHNKDNITRENILSINKKLNESSLSRLYDYIQSSDVAFVTAFKSPRWIKDRYDVGGSGASVPREVHKVNRERNNALLKNIQALGYSAFKVDGSYENQERKDAGLDNYTDKEESFAIVNRQHNKNFVEDIHNLANKYNQESILVVYAGGNKSKFIYADGTVEDAGKFTMGKDAPYKSLINGRPLVFENVSELIEPHIRTMKQKNDYMKEGYKMSTKITVVGTFDGYVDANEGETDYTLRDIEAEFPNYFNSIAEKVADDFARNVSRALKVNANVVDYNITAKDKNSTIDIVVKGLTNESIDAIIDSVVGMSGEFVDKNKDINGVSTYIEASFVVYSAKEAE